MSCGLYGERRFQERDGFGLEGSFWIFELDVSQRLVVLSVAICLYLFGSLLNGALTFINCRKEVQVPLIVEGGSKGGIKCRLRKQGRLSFVDVLYFGGDQSKVSSLC